MPVLPRPTHAEVHALITDVLETVDYQAPTVAYCVEVRDSLRARLPADALLDVHWRPGRLLVEIRIDALLVSRVVEVV